MAIALGTPDPATLLRAADALREWQDDRAPLQLHPGDLGWFWRFGPEATTAAVRTWSRDGRVLAVGLRDGARLLRLTTAPDLRRDEELAARLVADIVRPGLEVLPAGQVDVEAPADALVRDLLTEEGWGDGERFTGLRRDLTAPVEGPRVRVEVVGPGRAADRAAVQRAAFDGSTFTEDRWRAMAAGPLYAGARCLVAYDDEGHPVAAVTVWSAGPGRPGLLEPMGVHRDHRGRGHGRAITLAAAAALRELGSSTALVAADTANQGAVATYVSAGFVPLGEVPDRRRGPG